MPIAHIKRRFESVFALAAVVPLLIGLAGNSADAQPAKAPIGKNQPAKVLAGKKQSAKAPIEQNQPAKVLAGKKQSARAPIEQKPPTIGANERAARTGVATKKSPVSATRVAKKLSPLDQATQLLNAPEPAKVRAGLEQLKQIGKPVVVAPISERLRQGLPPPLVDLAIEVLIAAGSGRAEPVLTDLYSHRRASIREAAIRALGRLRVRRAAPLLRKALDDGEPKVRAAAAEALGRIGDRKSLKDLYASFERGETPVLEAIAALAASRDVDRLIGYLDRHPMNVLKTAFIKLFERKDFPMPGKLALIAGLGENGSPDAQELLRDRLGNLPQTNRSLFMRAIGKALARAQQARMDRVERVQPETKEVEANAKERVAPSKRPEPALKSGTAAGEVK